jgi:hypothetical protein
MQDRDQRSRLCGECLSESCRLRLTSSGEPTKIMQVSNVAMLLQPPTPSMPNRGALLVLVLLATGIAVGASAVWYHRQQTRRPLELWGTDGARLIERAPEVTLYRLSPAANAKPPNAQTIDIGGQLYQLSGSHDMAGAAGFSHARWGLCQDSSFDWQANCGDCKEPRWNFAIRFADGEAQTMLALDTGCGTVTQVGSQRCVAITPIADEVAQVLLRQLPDETQADGTEE